MSNWKTTTVDPTYRCNPAQLKHFRKRLNFTQDELARRAGYTVRVISKAESGRSISSDLVADLAEALSTDQTPVYPEDLIADPVQFARLWIEETYRNGAQAFDAVEPYLDEDVVLIVKGDPEEFPFAGTYEGPDGIRRMLELFFSMIEAPAGHDPMPCYNFIGNGNEVVIWGQSWLHPIGMPLEEPVDLAIRMQFSRGKLTRFEDRFDVQAGGDALAGNQSRGV